MYGARGRVTYCLQDNDPLSQCRQINLVMPLREGGEHAVGQQVLINTCR